MPEAPIIDQYSGMDGCAGMDPRSNRPPELDAAPRYLDARARRRLNFYARVRAYIETVSRYYVVPSADYPHYAEESRDFGDVGVLLGEMAAAALGQGVLPVIDEADDPIPDQPDLGHVPTPPPADTAPEAAGLLETAYRARLQRWQARAETALADWLDRIDLVDDLQARQEWLRDWARRDGLLGKIRQAESEYIVPLGDGVFVVGWDADAARVTIESVPPDAYHPVLDDAEPGRFPTKVHLAWIIDVERTDGSGKSDDYVRRITYELVPIDDPSLDGVDLGTGPLYLQQGERPRYVCLHSDGTWPLTAFENTKLDAMATGAVWRTITEPDGTVVELNRRPTGLDFLPIVHVPNELTGDHFGRSPVPRLVQLVDEIIATDTDAALATRWAARPPVVISGMGPTTTADGKQRSFDMTPGKGVSVEPGGSVSTVDMAPNLAQIEARQERLLKRLSVNARVPEGVVGRVDAGQVASGIALALSFTPFEHLVDAMRLAREDKYALLVKMVQRIAIQAGDETLNGDTRVFPGGLRFGAFMPSDLESVATMAGTLRAAKLLSQETGLRWLQEHGVPSDDLGAELASIRRVDMTAEADQVTGALENPRYAAQLMGIDDYEGPAGALDTGGGGTVAPPAGGAVPPTPPAGG